MSFQRLLQLGQASEREGPKIICVRNNVTVVLTQDDTNYRTLHHDFETSDGLSYEVKADFASMRTGNIFVEHRNNETPAGISISTARYHIILSGGYYLISTEQLKRMVVGCRQRSTPLGTWGYLVPRAVFVNQAELISAPKLSG